MLFLVLNSLECSENRWLCLPFCCFASPAQVLCLSLFIHSSAQKSIPQKFIGLTLSAKFSDGYSRGCKNEDILDAFQELEICGGDTFKYNKIHTDTEEIFVELALTLLFIILEYGFL